MAIPALLRAKSSYFAGDVYVAAGSLVREGHAVMQGAEHLYEKIKADFDYDWQKVETEAKKVEAAAKAAAAKKAGS